MPAATVLCRAAARAGHARRVRGPGAARVREHADRRHPAHADAARLRRDRGGPSRAARARDGGPAALPSDADATELAHRGPPAVIAAVDRAALLRLARPDRRLRRGRPGRRRVPRRRAASVLRISGAQTRAGPGARAARVRARPPAHDRPGPRVRAADARRHRDPRRSRRRSTIRRRPCRRSTGSSRCSPSSPRAIRARRSSSTTTGPRARSSRRRRWAAYMELGLMEIRRYGAESPQIVAPAQRALRPPARGRRRRRAPADRARAPPARASASLDAFPDPQERAIVERPDRLGLGGA